MSQIDVSGKGERGVRVSAEVVSAVDLPLRHMYLLRRKSFLISQSECLLHKPRTCHNPLLINLYIRSV